MLEAFDFQGYELTEYRIILLSVSALLIGMSKTGVHNAGMVVIPLLAIEFGGKASTGIVLPMLCYADVLAVWYYNRHAHWNHLKRLLPFAFLGVILGTVAGNYIDDQLFKQVMALIIFSSLIIMIWMERKKTQDIPSGWWFAAAMGILGGFTTMVGNLAGSVMALYLLSMRFPKNEFIGTAAWFFLVINLIKLPFHILAWETINISSFVLDTVLVPIIILGGFLGIAVVKRIPDGAYRWFILLMTAIAAIFMMF